MANATSHTIDPALLRGRVKVLLVGAGGSGSEMLRGLVKLNEALLALNHPGGLSVLVLDPDTVSVANIGRQGFWPADVGQNKGEVLISRINLGFGLDWDASPQALAAESNLRDFHLVIGCVDTRASRRAIVQSARNTWGHRPYYLDVGNRRTDGQFVLGQLETRQECKGLRLPHVADLFPEVADPEREGDDQGPSCSLADALQKQSLFINQGVVTHALALLWQLFRHGSVQHHGGFVNLETGRVTPLAVDPEAWARMGYAPKAAQKAA